MKLARLLLAFTFIACAAPSDADEELAESQDEIRTTGSFVSRGTGYYPANNSMEGGFLDRKGVDVPAVRHDGRAAIAPGEPRDDARVRHRPDVDGA